MAMVKTCVICRPPKGLGATILHAPLCPAGHLPHKGGDRPLSRPPLIVYVAQLGEAQSVPISPLVGEMSGRTE
ncbi:hypothetical protein EOC06_24055, partial [Mesorhizobium sp. M7A.F.Ca.MR.362.00.0.0]